MMKNEEIERIEVHVKIIRGTTECICMRSRKRCSRKCPLDIVTRDKYFEYEKTVNNRYGR